MSFAADYVDVAERIRMFREAYPDGCLQPTNPLEPFRMVETPDGTFVAYSAAAYRTPADPRPGIGTAWERVPGLTNFTRNSELQNAETSAWGRAIVAVGAADTKKGIASFEDVRNRQDEDAAPVAPRTCVVCQEPLTGQAARFAGAYAHKDCAKETPT